MSAPAPDRREIEATTWYHTLDLPGGITTPGYFDLRPIADRVLPADLSGKRCLDACTASGFWAFQLEKRGAREVVAIDIRDFKQQDWQDPGMAPPDTEIQRHSFEVAHAALGSNVQRKDLSVYDASPDALGTFDFVFIGSVLLHLRDPVQALRALRTVATGELRSFEVVLYWSSLLRPRAARGSFYTGGDARWWTPSAATHARWAEAAGFTIERRDRFIYQRFGSLLQSQPKGGNAKDRLTAWSLRRFGVPSQLLVCR